MIRRCAKSLSISLKEAAESAKLPKFECRSWSQNLQDARESIADAYVVVRGKLWWWNVGLLGGAIAYCGFGTAALKLWGHTWLWAAATGWQAWVVVALLMPLGAMVGLFIEFVSVDGDIPYEQLRAIDSDGRWKPFQRALNTTIAIPARQFLRCRLFRWGSLASCSTSSRLVSLGCPS